MISTPCANRVAGYPWHAQRRDDRTHVRPSVKDAGRERAPSLKPLNYRFIEAGKFPDSPRPRQTGYAKPHD